MTNASRPPALSIITVALDLATTEFAETAASLATLMNQHGRRQGMIEWLVVPGIKPPASLQERYPQARILPAQSKGIYEAMNAGLNHAAGAYIWFLNGGDELVSLEHAQLLLEALHNEPAADFIYTDSVEAQPDGSDWHKPSRDHQQISRGMFTHHQAMVYRRAVIDAEQYPSQYRIAADYAFTLKHLQKARHVLYLTRPLCRFRTGGFSSQRHRLGQREQRQIRREILGTSGLTECWTTLRQWLSQQLRHLAPALWQRLRVMAPQRQID